VLLSMRCLGSWLRGLTVEALAIWTSTEAVNYRHGLGGYGSRRSAVIHGIRRAGARFPIGKYGECAWSKSEGER
jgi:hypothetical protein